MPDKDVFVINAMANPPRPLPDAAGAFRGVGTILYTMAVNPVNGKVYVANTEANNAARFEGPGTFAGHSLRGHLHESRITVLSPGGGVAARHLNKHVDYNACCAPLPNAENDRSLALPQGMAVTADGATLYVAALGSDKVGIFSTAQLENDTFVPSAANHVLVSGGGPTGLVLNEAQGQLYVMTRFDNGISIVNTGTRTETPELNGAVLTCESCHRLDPGANPGTAAPGFFGTAGMSGFGFNPQLFKVPHLRNLYQKVGMFGNPENPGFLGGDNGPSETGTLRLRHSPHFGEHVRFPRRAAKLFSCLIAGRLPGRAPPAERRSHENRL